MAGWPRRFSPIRPILAAYLQICRQQTTTIFELQWEAHTASEPSVLLTFIKHLQSTVCSELCIHLHNDNPCMQHVACRTIPVPLACLNGAWLSDK